nr:hypothetical protein [Tanacetum cinerariifolium]
MGIRTPQSNVPTNVADETITKEMHDRLGRATTTDSSLEAEQERVTSLEHEITSTKAVYNKDLITLTKRGRMIEELDKYENVNLVKSSEQREVYETAEHTMDSLKDNDDETLAETLLNIKRSATKDKGKGGYKQRYFKGMKYEDIRPIFKRVWDQNHTFVPKDSKIEKEVMKRSGFDLQQESSKKQKLDEQADEEVEV